MSAHLNDSQLFCYRYHCTIMKPKFAYIDELFMISHYRLIETSNVIIPYLLSSTDQT